MTIRPCRHPQCDRDNGAPTLTALGLCEPCQTRTHRLAGRLVMDWATLTTLLPTPARSGSNIRTQTQKIWGHPAEWASDKARAIADSLNACHDALADTLTETPPPHPGITDRVRVRAAWRYMDPRIHLLAEQDWVTDTITEWAELHSSIRLALGHGKPRQALPTPCPQCELRTVARSLDANDTTITCGSCGWTVTADDYCQYTRIVLDTITDGFRVK